MDIYRQLWERCLPLLECFKTDLEVHDQATLEEYPKGTPFVHWTRKTGTDIVMLPTCEPDDRLRRCQVAMAKYHLNPFIPDLLVLHFDGKELREITAEQAYDIVMEWSASPDHHAVPVQN